MQLRCKYCDAVQPVTEADEADEDPRTQGIRRTFRAEHVERCGERAVSLELYEPGEYVDPALWDAYLAHVRPPTDVQIGADGFFSRPILRDGVMHNVRVCEDCWQNIPRYIDFPAGLVSPESDGAHVLVPKVRPTSVETANPNRSIAVEHLRKVVCLPCYLAAFQRVYPHAPIPEMRGDLFGDGAPVEPPAPIPAEMLGRLSVSRPGQEAAV